MAPVAASMDNRQICRCNKPPSSLVQGHSYNQGIPVTTVDADATYALVAVTSDGATSITFADIDGDGDQDLLTGQISGSLTYYRNNQVWTTLSLAPNLGVLIDPERMQRATDVAVDGQFAYVLSQATVNTGLNTDSNL